MQLSRREKSALRKGKRAPLELICRLRDVDSTAAPTVRQSKFWGRSEETDRGERMSHSVHAHSTLGTAIWMNSHLTPARSTTTHHRPLSHSVHAHSTLGTAISLLLATQPRIFVRVQTYSFTPKTRVILIRTSLSLGNVILSTGSVQTCLTRSSNHAPQSQPSASSNQHSATSTQHQQSAIRIRHQLSAIRYQYCVRDTLRNRIREKPYAIYVAIEFAVAVMPPPAVSVTAPEQKSFHARSRYVAHSLIPAVR